ncbi:phosphatidylethanolamine-binding protein [Lipomyces arxii]|uniref:phosphatidylethanolamine-binding protein n=1 Tax=Lipomyces arxii TaxID=56418 RepID=UPI0034CD101A
MPRARVSLLSLGSVRQGLRDSIRHLQSSSARASSTSPNEVEHSDFATEVEINDLPDGSAASERIAKAIGCSVNDLNAYFDPADPSTLSITAKSLKASPQMRTSLLEWRQNIPPISLRTERAKKAYRRPIGLNAAFEKALKVLTVDKHEKYERILRLTDKVEGIINQFNVKAIDEIPVQKKRSEAYLTAGLIRKLRIDAEINFPEVTSQFEMGKFDMRLPVYQHLVRARWEKNDRLLLIDRMESMHVIPDTLPTLYPQVDVKVRFPGTNTFWIDPGRVMSTGVTASEPKFSIQMFEDSTKLFTIVIVDPDTPDLLTDSYKTTLHYILSDISISGNSPLVDKANANELVSYLPPHPEKNSGYHRYAVWVFEQPNCEPLSTEKLASFDLQNRDSFDIRRFSQLYGLKAVGAHFWRNKYDSRTESVREKYGLPQGLVYSHKRYQHYEDYAWALPDLEVGDENKA